MPKVKSLVEARVESLADQEFGEWLLRQSRGAGRVAARDGVREVVEFGAVNPLGGLVLPEWRFEEAPGLALSRLLLRWREETAPVVVLERSEVTGEVSLRLGRHVPVSRAHAGSVLLG